MTTECCAAGDCVPLKTLDSLLSWSADSVDSSLIGRDLDSSSRDPLLINQPQTMVCHDMKGGYLLEDKSANGCKVDKNQYQPFYLRHWWYTDIFVYFTHHLVTIPPVGWINAAHKHGVIVLGTFITEWEDGARICCEMFQDKSKLDRVIDCLVQISMKYNFEGWLINIENIVQYEHIDALKEFLSILTKRLRAIRGSNSRVIWYDSVIASSGRLKWQDELNSLNKPFFDLCDGIYLNYTWTESSLKWTLYESVGRKCDVFVGVDVFGRNCMEGAGLNCNQPLEFIRKYGFSVAIFAFGWILETLPREQFTQNMHRFWDLLSNFLYCRKIRSLPIETSFSNGLNNDCFNLSNQQLQPHFLCQHNISLTFDRISQQHLTLNGHGYFRLFCLDILCNETIKIEMESNVNAKVEFCVEIKHSDNTEEKHICQNVGQTKTTANSWILNYSFVKTSSKPLHMIGAGLQLVQPNTIEIRRLKMIY